MKGRRFGIVAVVVAAVIAIVITGSYQAGLRLNFTESAPAGLWFVESVGVDSLKPGDLVEVCPPDLPIVRLMSERGYLEAGNCQGSGVRPLLKPVSAVAGDVIQFESGKPVIVNGAALPNTAVMSAVPGWPEGCYMVQPDEVWLFSSYNPGSFDSRYFGPVKLASVRGLARPVVVKGDPAAMLTGVKK